METLSISRLQNLEGLRTSVKSLGQQKMPRCCFEIKCWRRFCKFDYSSVFRKVNQTFDSKVNESNCSSKGIVSRNILCETCGLSSINQEGYFLHVNNTHKKPENVEHSFECKEFLRVGLI